MNRLLFLAILTFWVVMNYLLWRAEFAADPDLGSPIPPEIVWRKILTAPDDSSLGVFQGGQRIGFCRVVANVGEEAAPGKTAEEGEIPEGMVRSPSGFTVDIDGNVMLQFGTTNRLKFALNAAFDNNRTWKVIKLRLGVRPMGWELKMNAKDRSVRFRQEMDGDEVAEHVWTLDDLRDPQKMVRDVAGPLAAQMLVGLPLGRVDAGSSFGLRWEARNDWLKVGLTRIRVHRLTAKLMDRYSASIVVSRVGEILRVELPNNTVMSNDALFVQP